MADEISTAFSKAFRDFVVDGVSSSGRQEPNKAEIRAIGPVIEKKVTAAAEGNVVGTTWVALAAIDGTRDGQPGLVPENATGTHTGYYLNESGAVVSGTVNNSGEYAWSESLSAWVRVGDVSDYAADIAELHNDLDAEAAARLQVRLDSDANIQAERVTRQSEDIALAASAPVAARPGEAGKFFIDRLDGGLPAFVTGLSSGAVVTNDDGYVIRVSGAGIIANRPLFAIEPDRLYRITFAVRRFTNPNDPANDAVRLALAWYSATMGRLGSPVSTVVQDLVNFTTGSGRQVVSAIVARTAQDGVDIVTPSGAIYARPYVQTYGDVAKTDIEVLRVEDITGADFVAPDVDALAARITAVESIDAGDRLDDLETTVTALEGSSVAYEQLPQRTLMAPAWRGGYETTDDASWRLPEIADTKLVQSGIFGDMPLVGWLRSHGLPVEIEYLNGQVLDAQQAAAKLIELHRPHVVIFGQPTYLMDNVIPYELIKDITLRSHSAGIDSPPTMRIENPAHTPFSFTTGNDNVRMEGVWSIEHREEPTSALTIQFDGCKNIHIDTLVCRNANQALRFDQCDNIHIETLVTDAVIAFEANATATNVTIGRHIKIGAKANTVTGAQYVSVGKPSAGLWTPTIDFDTHGDLSVVYSNTAAFYERIGKQVFVHGSITFTPTFTTAAGAFRLGGLPFLAKAGNDSGFIGINSMSAITWPTISGSVATQSALSVVAGNNYMRLIGQRSGGGTGNFSVTHIVTGVSVTLRFSGFYEAEV